MIPQNSLSFGLFADVLVDWRFWVLLDIQREEKNVQKAIKEAAKRNDMGSAKVFVCVVYIYF